MAVNLIAILAFLHLTCAIEIDGSPGPFSDEKGTPNLIELAVQLNLTTCVEKLKKVGIDRIINHEVTFKSMLSKRTVRINVYTAGSVKLIYLFLFSEK